MSETTAPVTAPVAAPVVHGISPEAMAMLLADIERTGNEIIAEMDALGPAVTEDQMRETAAADPVAAQALLDGHLAAGKEQAELAKKAVMDKIKAVTLAIAAAAAGGAAGGPGGAAAAGALASAVSGKG